MGFQKGFYGAEPLPPTSMKEAFLKEEEALPM